MNARRHALAAPSARSLLLTVLGEYVLPHGGAAWSGTLISALGSLGIDPRTARQAVSRTALDGWLRSERSGRHVRWALTPSGEALLREGADRIYSFGGAVDDWDGTWILVMGGVPESQRDLRHRLRTRLAWAGFGSLAPGVWLSPHAAREHEAVTVLRDLGLDEHAVSFRASTGELGSERELLAAWDLDELSARYVEFIEEFDRAHPTDAREWFVQHTRLVHEWRKFPFIDPGFPLRLLPAGWIGLRARDLFRTRRACGVREATSWFDAAAS